MNEIRKKRLEEAIRREVSNLILKKRIKDERIGLVSVTRVELLPDLSKMKVFISPFGDEEMNRLTWRALLSCAVEFQNAVGKNLRLRETPHLWYEVDTSIREGDRIIDLLESG